MKQNLQLIPVLLTIFLTPFSLETPKGEFTNSADPDQILPNVVSDFSLFANS